MLGNGLAAKENVSVRPTGLGSLPYQEILELVIWESAAPSFDQDGESCIRDDECFIRRWRGAWARREGGEKVWFGVAKPTEEPPFEAVRAAAAIPRATGQRDGDEAAIFESGGNTPRAALVARLGRGEPSILSGPISLIGRTDYTSSRRVVLGQ